MLVRLGAALPDHATRASPWCAVVFGEHGAQQTHAGSVGRGRSPFFVSRSASALGTERPVPSPALGTSTLSAPNAKDRRGEAAGDGERTRLLVAYRATGRVAGLRLACRARGAGGVEAVFAVASFAPLADTTHLRRPPRRSTCCVRLVLRPAQQEGLSATSRPTRPGISRSKTPTTTPRTLPHLAITVSPKQMRPTIAPRGA
jgi:hypothetical protein